jgi:hypothetical protein
VPDYNEFCSALAENVPFFNSVNNNNEELDRLVNRIYLYVVQRLEDKIEQLKIRFKPSLNEHRIRIFPDLAAGPAPSSLANNIDNYNQIQDLPPHKVNLVTGEAGNAYFYWRLLRQLNHLDNNLDENSTDSNNLYHSIKQHKDTIQQLVRWHLKCALNSVQNIS